MKKVLLILSIIFFTTSPALANGVHEQGMKNGVFHGEGHEHEVPEIDVDKSINVKSGYAVIQVNGLVCDICSRKVRKDISKLLFIDSVDVDLEKQKLTIKIKEGKTLDLKVLGETIRKGGFNPFMAYTLDENGKVIVQKM